MGEIMGGFAVKSGLVMSYFFGWAYAGMLFAQGEIAAPAWLSVIVQLGSFGLIVWLIVNGMPRLRKEVSDDQKAERADFRLTVKEILSMTSQETEKFRIAAKEGMGELSKVFHQEQREMREFFREEATATRQMYIDSIGAMRSAVHDMKDTASVAVNKAQTAIETAKILKS